MRSQPGVEMIKHHARLHGDRARVPVKRDYFIQMPGQVQHQRSADGLAALGSATTAGQHRHPLLDRNLQRRQRIVFIFGHDHAYRINLIN